MIERDAFGRVVGRELRYQQVSHQHRCTVCKLCVEYTVLHFQERHTVYPGDNTMSASQESYSSMLAEPQVAAKRRGRAGIDMTEMEVQGSAAMAGFAESENDGTPSSKLTHRQALRCL